MGYFYGRLKEERKRLGLNQDEFAALGGVKKGAQFNYENGSRNPDSEYLVAIAAGGVDVLYLLTGEHASSALSGDEKELLKSYRSLDIRGKAGLLGMIEGIENAEAKMLTMLQRRSIATKVDQLADANGMASTEIYQFVLAEIGAESIVSVPRDQYGAIMKLLDRSLVEAGIEPHGLAQDAQTKATANVVFHGKVTQQITGDITAPQTNVFGSGKKKSKEEK